jgi:Carboxypeptidase regulatory-like domain/Tetratricopeptide repeat
MNRLAPAFACFVLAVSCANSTCAQNERRHIEGKVFDASTGQPAPSIIVTLESGEGLRIGEVASTSEGDFSFNSLATGVFTVAISTQDYEPVSQTFDLYYGSVNGAVLDLVPRGGKRAPPVKGSAVSAHVLSVPQKARDAYDAGRKKMEGKDPTGAISEFQQAIAAEPGFYEAYELLGRAYLQLNQSDEAEKAFRKSVDVSQGKYVIADFDLGSTLMDRLQFAEGEQIVRRGLELEPNQWLGLYELGRALFYQHHVEEAQKSVEQARSLNPNVAVIYRLLANIHVAQHNNVALLADLDSYIRLDPDSPNGVHAKKWRDQLAAATPSTAPHFAPASTVPATH